MEKFFKALFTKEVEVTSKEKFAALKEALADTGVGAAINIPINFTVVWLAFYYEWGALETSIILTATFTAIAVVRKMTIRLGFLKLHRLAKKSGIEEPQSLNNSNNFNGDTQ